jgi:hypothetical protein
MLIGLARHVDPRAALLAFLGDVLVVLVSLGGCIAALLFGR